MARTSFEYDLIGSVLDGKAQLQSDLRRAVSRLDSRDNEGAITAARSLIESSCKHVLELLGETPNDKDELPALYRNASKLMRLAPHPSMDQLNKEFFNSTLTIVKGIGELRNRVGDAHGKGHQPVLPTRSQAILAVQMSVAMSAFLLNSLASHVAREKHRNGATLKFPVKTIARLIDHTAHAPEHLKTYGKRGKPGLWLVGDAGIYIMSNGAPPIMADGRIGKKEDETPRLVAYADGCSAYDDVDNWWPIHNSIAGGDDFTFFLPLKTLRAVADEAATYVYVIAEGESLRLTSDVQYARELSLDPA